MKKSVFPIILFILFCYTNSVWAQQLALRTYTTEEGLAQNSIYSAIQDHKGYLWFATQGGLSKFDGVVFTNYTKSDGLIANDISCIHEDRKGNLWVGLNFEGGICGFNGKGFTTIHSNTPESDAPVYAICESSSGALLLGTRGIRVQKLVNGKLTAYEHNSELKRDFVRSLIQDSKGNLWFGYGSEGGGISRFDGRNFFHYSVKDGLADDHIINIYEDKNGNLWIGTYKGLSKFDGKKFSSFSFKDGLPAEPVLTIVEDSRGIIWLGTNTCGLFKYEKGKFTEYTIDNGLSNNDVRCLLEDKRGDLWVCTYGGGINKLAYERYLSFTLKDHLPSANIYGINEDSQGNIWFGTEGGGACRLKDGKIDVFNTSNGLNDNIVYAIYCDKKSAVWLGTRNSGICKYENGRYTYLTAKDGLAGDYINSIKEDRYGNIWIATYSGLSRYDGRKFTNFHTSDGLGDDNAGSILLDRQGTLWFATPGGLSRYDGNVFTNFTTKDGLTSNSILSVYEDHAGLIWVTTEDGGIGYLSEGKFRCYTTNDGLTSNLCYSIVEDQQFIYIATGRGINRIEYGQFFNSSKLTPKVYKAIDGLPSSEYNQCSVFKDSKGNKWFGTTKGLVMFYPYEKPNAYPPQIYITRFKVNGKDTTTSSGLELKHDQNYISIEFAGVYFASPENTVFSYHLEGGKDTTWREINQRSLFFSNLNFGKYTFCVKARNSDGVWSSNIAQIEFEINPPYYLTKWFISVVVILILISVYGFYRFKTQQVQKRNIELGIMVKERTKELEEEKNKSDELLHNILPGSTVEELKKKGYVKPREIDNISILFTDFKGFTYIAGMLPAELLVDELNDMFRNFDEIIENNGVEKLKTIGDSYMIASGLPEKADDHPIRIIKVGMEMLAYIKERNKTSAIKWEMRAGVHSGTVIAGVVGKKKFSYDIWGDTVNIASRMESAGAPGEINISAYTYMLVKDYYDCEYRGKVAAKGKGELDMYFVKGIKEQVAEPVSVQ